jgi:hypothetical protein
MALSSGAASGVPSRACFGERQSDMQLWHALIESRLNTQYGEYRAAMTPATVAGLTEEQIRQQYSFDNYNRIKKEVEAEHLPLQLRAPT